MRRHRCVSGRHRRSKVAPPDRQLIRLRPRISRTSIVDQPPPCFVGRTPCVVWNSRSFRHSVRENIVTKRFGHHTVVNRIECAHQSENPPQRARVFLSRPCPIPLIETSILVFFVGGQPQFRDKSGKSNEKWCVQQAFGAKKSMCAATDASQSKGYDEDNRLDGRGPFTAVSR